jgi:hypothetical protein
MSRKHSHYELEHIELELYYFSFFLAILLGRSWRSLILSIVDKSTTWVVIMI